MYNYIVLERSRIRKKEDFLKRMINRYYTYNNRKEIEYLFSIHIIHRMSYYQDPASTGGVYAFIIEYSSTRSHWSNWAKSYCNKYRNIRTKTFRCICTGLKQTVILSQPINQYRSYRNISSRKFWYICTGLKQTLFL